MLNRALQGLIRLYQRYISPHLGHRCRFVPSCSQYMSEALQVHGVVKGLLLGSWRILRCNPMCKWGFDPVPPKGAWVSPDRKLCR